MKRWFLLTLILSSGCLLSAQHINSASVLEGMRNAIKQFPAAQLSFEFVATDGSGSVSGEYSGMVATQGNAFKMVNEDMEIYCDGNSKWIFNKVAGELTILPNDTTVNDIAENPIGFLSRLGGEKSGYKYSGKPNDSKGLWEIELTPDSKRLPYKKVIVSVNKENLLPAAVRIVSGDGTVYRITVTNFRKAALSEISAFAFPKMKMDGIVVTDLR